MFSPRPSEEELRRLGDEALFTLSLKYPSFFTHVLERYQGAFLRKAKSIIKDGDTAEDIVQETFVKIYRRGATFTEKGNGSFKAWAYKVLMNTALTQYQKEKGKGAVEFSPELSEILPDLAEEEARDNLERQDYITSVLGRMPKNLAHILAEFFLKGKSQEEIAREGNLTVGAVKVRIYRAKEVFREISKMEVGR